MSYRETETYARAVLRAKRQRAAMRHRVAALRDAFKNPLTIRV